MIPGIKTRPMPLWLSQINNCDVLPIGELLANSLYYPSSGRDGDPVRYLAGLVHSFIYVDYAIEHDDMLASMHHNHHGFNGYSILCCRDVSEKELTPEGWQSLPLNHSDGNPEKYRDMMKPPCSIWAIYQRNQGLDDTHGPERFSFLYICGDGVATFQALYHGNKCAPDVVAIIQPGTGFGRNWTDFENPSMIFARSVLGNKNGKPEFLLYGGVGDKACCWPAYENLIHYWKLPAGVGGALGLWQKNR